MLFRSYISKYNILPENQSGFRKNFSTTTLLCKLKDDILDNWDTNFATNIVFLDLTKAFDSLNYMLLLAKLKYISCSKKTCHWFVNYLSNRNQITKITNEYILEISKKVPITK